MARQLLGVGRRKSRGEVTRGEGEESPVGGEGCVKQVAGQISVGTV